MAAWINWTGNGEINTSSAKESAIKKIFWDILPGSVFRAEIRTSPETILWLIQQWTEKDWQNYANMETETGNREIDWLLDVLYPYFNNPHYEWPEAWELNPSQQEIYNFVTSRLSQTQELVGVSAVIPHVKAQVQGGMANRWNQNPWLSVAVEIETHGSKKK